MNQPSYLSKDGELSPNNFPLATLPHLLQKQLNLTGTSFLSFFTGTCQFRFNLNYYTAKISSHPQEFPLDVTLRAFSL